MSRTSRERWQPLLAYSTNVHEGESLAGVYRFLKDYTIPIKKLVFGRERGGVELRLGMGAARDLKSASARAAFGAFLEENGLFIFSINAYPLLDFHARRVKENVFRPSWTEKARSQWTSAIAEIFAELLPAGTLGTISTLGGAFRRREHGPATFRKLARQYLETLETLARIEASTGKTILLAVEPEPETTFETARDVIEFVESYLLPAAKARWQRRGLSSGRAEERVRRFFTVNCDTCHFSVLFEDPVKNMRQLWRAGLEVGKLHVTSALSLRHPGRRRAAYAQFRRRRRGVARPRP